VNRVAAHPVLCKSPDLQLFLEATEDTWAVEMARGQVGRHASRAAAAAGYLQAGRHACTSPLHLLLHRVCVSALEAKHGWPDTHVYVLEHRVKASTN
jgi:hypothetical protein